MDKDNEIDLQQEEEISAENQTQLPVNFLSFGEIVNDDVKVYIHQDVYNALEKYALEDVEHERGTILLGSYSEELGKTNVILSAYIEAKYTDASASTLTFTHETWEYVHQQQDKLHADKKILGWQHTHPNYGIFLSNYDLFIQENFFNMPFQVAYVIDPIQNLRGFFQWKDGKIEKLKGFFVFDEVGKPIKVNQLQKKPEEKKAKSIGGFSVILMTILCILSVVFVFMLASLSKKLETQQKQQEALASTVSDQNMRISSLQSALEAGGAAESGEISISDLYDLVNEQQIQIDNQQATIDELQTLVEAQADNSETMIVFMSYTVQPGDTLGRICRQKNIDYDKYIDLIMNLNSIEDANVIYIGQTLLLPIQKLN